MRIEIDLGAIAANYRACGALAPNAQIGAVIKADAYGLGMAEIAPVLWRAGCRVFFTALLEEGIALRALLPEAEIYLLNGLAEGEAEQAAKQNLHPCLASLAQIEEWAQYCRASGKAFPAALHIESGMNRLGMSAGALKEALKPNGALAQIKPVLLMSHLACAGEPEHKLNRRQLDEFVALRQMIEAQTGALRASLANSAGMMLGRDWQFDLIRTGIALYGGIDHAAFKGAVRAWGRVIGVKQVAAGGTAGYGADWRASTTSRLAVVAAGYADGLPYHLWPPKDGGQAHLVIAGKKVPLAGRVSMDMVSVDISSLPPDSVQRGSKAEILGDTLSLNAMAQAANSIPHAILTGLGKRGERRYIAPSPN